MKAKILSGLLASSMVISLALFTSGCVQKNSASALDNVSFDTKALENYCDDNTQARYVEVSGLSDAAVQEKLNQTLKNFCLAPASSAEKDITYDIMPIFEMLEGIATDRLLPIIDAIKSLGN